MDKSFYEREITVRLFQASNVLQTFLDKMLKPDNLTAKQFFMMIIISAMDDNPKIGELAETFKTSHQNVKQICLKLQKQNYVTLYKDKQDARITRVALTDHAFTYWKKRDTKDNQIMHHIYDPISLDDMKIFRQSLLTLMDVIEAMDVS